MAPYIPGLVIEEAAIANLWTKKNPFLSMVLSRANAMAGHARVAAIRQARRNQSTAVKQAAQSWMDLWVPKSGRKRGRAR